ncbi:hypothetical protein SEA_BANTAM_75 [Gordonia phage Bantam]|uniref:Acb2/Tad1 hairpin domain-containing protein n=1 Tax=Gordonia phage Bantam TaxID=1887641 RepID=A0A1B3AYE7_9CAUD|nr:hypothetical protein BIZ77_gp104 [Gordonia phage Bantam]AOE43764.1 hypothetical protein SEA_BANTAM_75 [Gordonia phage Bantam]
MSTFASSVSTKDIDHRFDFHPATTIEKRNDHASIRETLKHVAHFIDANVPPGREKSLAITHLEEAMFWGNAAIARNQESQ